jgi:hypothetical protein
MEASMADPLDSVKSLAKQFRTWSANAQRQEDAEAAARWVQHAVTLDGVAEELARLQRISQPIPASYGDLSDLPPELLKELSGIKADDMEQQLFTIIKSGDGQVDLDSILIELYRRFKVVETRKYLQNKLWRMAQKGMIWTVAGRKGVYSAAEPPKPAPARPQPTFDTDLDDVPF